MKHSKKKMKTIYLYPAERTLFGKTPEDVHREFAVQDESMDFIDSPKRLHTRLSLVRLHDPKLLTLRDRVQSGEDVLTAIKNLSIAEVGEDDLSELFFAMGPSLLTGFIMGLLSSAKTDADFLSIAALADIRHALLISFTSR